MVTRHPLFGRPITVKGCDRLCVCDCVCVHSEEGLRLLSLVAQPSRSEADRAIFSLRIPQRRSIPCLVAPALCTSGSDRVARRLAAGVFLVTLSSCCQSKMPCYKILMYSITVRGCIFMKNKLVKCASIGLSVSLHV